MVFFLLIGVGVSGSKSPVPKYFYTFTHTAFIYRLMYFIFGRKITCMAFPLDGVRDQFGQGAKDWFWHFCPYAYLLTDVFHIWKEDNFHDILLFDWGRGQGQKNAKNKYIFLLMFYILVGWSSSFGLSLRSVRSMSPVLKIDLLKKLLFLTDIFHIWKYDHLHRWIESGVSWIKVTSALNRFLHFFIQPLFYFFQCLIFIRNIPKVVL
jgi:hypothetical protein